MADITTILVATDFSEGSAKACEMARSLSMLSGAKLVLLHVINEFADRRSRQVPSEVIDTLIREVERHAVEDMREFRKRFFSDCDVSTEILLGKADVELLQLASKIKADLIIIGAHQRAGIRDLILGSTAEKVVRSSTVPVLTVPG